MKINLKIFLAIYRIGTSRELFNTESREYYKISNYINSVKSKNCHLVPIRYLERLFSSLKSDRDDFKIGYVLGKDFRLFDMGTLGYYLYSSKTIAGGLRKIPQYEFLISDCIYYEIFIEKNLFTWESSLNLLKGTMSKRTFYIFSIFELVARHSIVNKLLQKRINPKLVGSIVAADEIRLKDLFSCPIRKGNHKNKIIYDFEMLNEELQTSNEKMNKELERIIFSEIDKEGIYTRLTSVFIKNNLEKDTFSIRDVATYLNVSERNLQRKLRKEGTNYQDLLNETRKELAQFYMNKGILIKNISAKLGYKESNSFIRAYKRWNLVEVK